MGGRSSGRGMDVHVLVCVSCVAMYGGYEGLLVHKLALISSSLLSCVKCLSALFFLSVLCLCLIHVYLLSYSAVPSVKTVAFGRDWSCPTHRAQEYRPCSSLYPVTSVDSSLGKVSDGGIGNGGGGGGEGL